MKKKFGLILLISISLIVTACSSKNTDEQNSIGSENQQKTEKPKEEKMEYLVSKYIELEKGTSFEDIKSKLEKDGISIKDSGEFEAKAGYLKREVSFIEGDNKLDLVFRDDKLGAKTFTYNTNDSKSTWFYTNYYDILENDASKEDENGIWKDSITKVDCSGEYDMIIKIQDEL